MSSFACTPSTEDLAKALGWVAPVATDKQVELFRNVLLTADEQSQSLTLRATDSVIAASARVPATVRSSGSVSCPAVHLNKLVKSLSTVAFCDCHEKDGQLIVAAGRSKSKIPTYDRPSWPEWHGPSVSAFTAETGPLRDALGWTLPSAAPDSASGLQGVIILAEGGFLRMSVTDGRRAARATVPAPGSKKVSAFVLSPAAKRISTMARLTAKGPVHFDGDSKRLFFWNDEGLGCSCLLGSPKKFDFESTIPSRDFKHAIQAPREALLNAVTRGALTDPTKLLLTARGSELTVIAASPKGGFEEALAVEGEGSFDLNLHPAYLGSFLQHLDSEEILLYYWDKHLPVLITASGDDSLSGIMMQMR